MNQKLGKVILAGAGPGDPELITLKALQYLQQADVIITDRLVSEELLTENIKPGAALIRVGKQCGKDSTSQDTINRLLLESATRHSLVVRLKGGDVSFFSNVLDELRTLVAHSIPYEIVPGVTAASGAAAYAGIPLTARGYASAVRFLTGHQTHLWDDSNWMDLVTTDDTLVLYMSAAELALIVKNLLHFGISKDKLLAVVEQATTPFQKVRVFSLDQFLEVADGVSFVSPSLVILGRVVALHRDFQWLDKGADQTYFPSLSELKLPVEA